MASVLPGCCQDLVALPPWSAVIVDAASGQRLALWWWWFGRICSCTRSQYCSTSAVCKRHAVSAQRGAMQRPLMQSPKLSHQPQAAPWVQKKHTAAVSGNTQTTPDQPCNRLSWWRQPPHHSITKRLQLQGLCSQHNIMLGAAMPSVLLTNNATSTGAASSSPTI